jgi:hypothetical protein
LIVERFWIADFLDAERLKQRSTMRSVSGRINCITGKKKKEGKEQRKREKLMRDCKE